MVGAGVIGLAVARELGRAGRSVLILEREATFGSVTSARNSEVIHAGIYYPRGSRKADFCVRGRERLYEYCATRGVPHRKTGKWIVATADAQFDQLDSIARAAQENGVVDVHPITCGQAIREEPELRCIGVLVSPSTGIIDSHAYMLSLLGEAEDEGAVLVPRTNVSRVGRAPGGLAVNCGDDAGHSLLCEWIVNCAGLAAPGLASCIEGFPSGCIPKAYYAKGSYFALSRRSPFSRLIYPVPEPGGLGVHLTLDMAGRARFGPDVEWVESPNYDVDVACGERFYRLIRTYWPGLEDGALEPAYAGVRPKLSGPGESAADFRIDGPAVHGVEGVINLFGIESPGLTASLSIAEHVRAIIETEC